MFTRDVYVESRADELWPEDDGSESESESESEPHDVGVGVTPGCARKQQAGNHHQHVTHNAFSR